MTTHEDLIVVKAHITMKSTAEGGRKHGFISGYRPNHFFDMPETGHPTNSYIGDILFEGKEHIEPGESAIVTVRFMVAGNISRYMRPGQKWFINESLHNIGYGEILEILS